MATTQTTIENASEESNENDCDEDWCNGPETDPLPCFDCFHGVEEEADE